MYLSTLLSCFFVKKMAHWKLVDFSSWFFKFYTLIKESFYCQEILKDDFNITAVNGYLHGKKEDEEEEELWVGGGGGGGV